MNQEELERANKLKLDRLKGTWYHSTPEKLYDLCIRKVVRNINLIISKSPAPNKPSSKSSSSSSSSKPKYRINESVGPLPNPICESLIREYAKYYVETLSQLERDEYFNNINNEAQQQQQQQANKPKRLVSYYDVLMAFVCTPEKCSLATIDYRQCLWATSTLETRLRQKLEAQLSRTFSSKLSEPNVQSNYFKIIKIKPVNNTNNSAKQRLMSSSSSESILDHTNQTNAITLSLLMNESTGPSQLKLSSIRSRQPPHLIDANLKSIIRNQKKLVYIDLCPCMLTNRTILWINKYLSAHLKCLRLQNCCNWTSTSEQAVGGNGVNNEENIFHNIFDAFVDPDRIMPDFFNNETNNAQRQHGGFDELVNYRHHRGNHRNEGMRRHFVVDDEEINDLSDDEDDAMENFFDEDDDDNNFGAYLQEYVSRYEQYEQQQQQQQNSGDKATASGKKRRHKSGKRKNKKKHHRHECKHDVGMKSGAAAAAKQLQQHQIAKHSSSFSQKKKKKKSHRRKDKAKYDLRKLKLLNKQLLFGNNNLERTIGVIGGERTVERFPPCKLFMPASSLVKKPRHHTHHHHHHHHHGHTNNQTHKHHKASCRRHKSKKKKLHRHHHHHHHHSHKSHQKKAPSNRGVEEEMKTTSLNDNANEKVDNIASQASSQPQAQQQQQQPLMDTPTSILKWLVKRAILNTNAVGPNSNNNQASASSSQTQQQQQQQASNSEAGEASGGAGVRPSLIEQIKKKASLLAETKMIDKVSISSSNYDEYDLNNMNSGSIGGGSIGGGTGGESGSNQIDWQSINEPDGDSADMIIMTGGELQPAQSNPNDTDENYQTKAPPGGSKFIADFDSNSFSSDSSSIYLSYHTNDSMKSSASRSSSISSSSSSSSLASSTSSSSSTSCSSTSSSSSSMSLLSSLSLLSTSSPASSGSSSGSSSSDHSSCSSSYSSCCSSSYECDSCDMDSLASSSSITSSSSSMSSSSSDFDSSSSLSSSSSDADEDATERHSKLLKPGENNQTAIEKRRYIKNKRRRLSKKLKEISERLSETAEAASGENATAAATLPSTSSSSAPPAVLDNTAAKSEELAAAVLSSKKVQRQQKLLEKVANLGSSPINVIQAIAAKALNFKLKNSRAAAMKSQSQQLYHHNHGHHRHHHHHHHHNNNSSRYPPSHLGRQDSSSSASSLANVKRLSQLDFDTASKRRLLRQYKFLKSTNMTQVGGASSSSAAAAAAVDESSSQALDELIRNLNNQVSSELQQQQQQQQESKLTAINDEAMSTSTPPNSDHTLDVNYNKSKRLKEEHAAHKRNASASNDVEMTAAGDRPGTSKSFEQQQSQQQQQQQQNQQQSLFSVLKYWMSKRVDPIGSNEAIAVKDSSPPRTTVEGSSSKMIEGGEENTSSPRHQNKRKSTDQKMPVDTQPCEESNLNNSALVDLKSKQQHLKKKNSSKSSSHHRSGHHKRKEKDHRHHHHHHHHRHHKRPHHHHHHHRHHQSSSQPKSSSTTNRRNLPSLPSPPQPHVDQMLVETLNLSKLQHLSLRNLGPYVIKRTMLNSLLKNFKCLKYLDISNCCTNQLFIVRPATSSMDLVGGSGDSTSSVAAAAAAVVVDMTRMISNAAGGVNAAATVGEAQPQASTNQPNELVGCLDGLTHLAPTLTHLLMADLNVDDIQANLKFILKLKALKHLDISNCREKPPLNRYKNPSLLLGKLAHHLTSLTSLDISGTNLTGSTIFKEQDEIDYIKKRLYDDLSDEYNDYARVKLDAIETISSGIAGLMFLNNEHKRLDFLGCFCCDNSIGARAAPIPATRIAAESAEAYLYAALECFLHDRPLFLLDALNHLFELYRDESVEDKLWGGHLIMDTMERHLDNSRIQISGSASLFYVLKYCKEENVQLPSFYLKRLILAVINGMEQHIDESAMRRNCVLIMCRLNLPDDVLFVSDRLIRILLKIFEDYVEERQKNGNDRPEHFVLRTAMHLLNILACSVHGNDKSKVGALSIPVAMSLIRTKTKFKEPDDVLEVTWSFLWNITDETPENCETFLDKCDGMSAFMECIQFKKSEILRNMMGLLGNVAEVKALRNRLCKNELISTFRELLFQTNDGIEIAYNSAGVLVHIMSDGAEAWTRNLTGDETTPVLLTERDSVILDIETAIDKWDLNSDRNINYRSFQPIFRLVEQFENPICQRWASWALANLTTVYPNTYCPLFEREQGRELMERVLNDSNVNDTIKRYANIVLHNVDRNKL